MKLQWIDSRGRLHDVPPEYSQISVDLDEHRYEWDFHAEDEVVDSLRILPDSGLVAFQLLSLEVDRDTPAGLVNLRRVASGSEDLGVLALRELRHFQVNGFTYFICESEQADLGLKLSDHEMSSQDYYHVRVRILLLDAAYVASFRRYFLDQLKAAEIRLSEQDDQLARFASTCEKISTLEQELRILKSSRVWRLAEWCRRTFYGRLLERFPRLRERLLDLSRRRVRAIFSGHSGTDLGTLVGNRIRLDSRDEAYQRLVDYRETTRPDDAVLFSRIQAFSRKPLISVVMPVHDTPVDWLRAAVGSVLGQRYDNLELCIHDDGSKRAETLDFLASLDHPRVRQSRSEENLNISESTNRALRLVTGEFVAFMDHDDQLDLDALFHVADAINEMEPDVIYTDEDYIDADGRFHRPNFKPDFSPDLLLAHNYVTHLLVVRTTLLATTGGLNPEHDGAQDYDLLLRLCELAGSIVHIPKVLYHWRQSAASSSLSVSAKPYIQERTRQVLSATMQRRGIDADIVNANIPHFFYTRRRLDGTPSVSIIVPFRDEPALMEKCFNSVLKKTTYSEYEIIGVNNQSVSPITYELMEAYRTNPRVRFIDHDKPFNFSAIVNQGVEQARGDYLVLLNNDVEIITWQWLEELLRQATNESTGAVGGKLLYPDNTVQHAGIVVGIDGYAGHAHKRFECHAQGYGNRLQLVQNVSAVTGAFMMVRKNLFHSVGGFDAEEFPVACNDVDFCLRLSEAGFWNVFTPYALAYHAESASRGYELTEEKRKRYEREKARFRERHVALLEMGDPFYNPNLSLDNESWMIRIPRVVETGI